MARAVILDANLLVLLVVGNARRSYIDVHKRLAAYNARDYDAVTRLVAGYQTAICIPHVLSEASSLLRQIDEPARSDISNAFAGTIRRITERSIDSAAAVRRQEYRWLGLTDAALLELAASGGTLLTVDDSLYTAALRAGYAATNYLHLKALRSKRP